MARRRDGVDIALQDHFEVPIRAKGVEEFRALLKEAQEHLEGFDRAMTKLRDAKLTVEVGDPEKRDG